MHRFWSWLGLNLGKHWIAVLLVGAVVTVGLGFGTTKLEFSTDQSNYLNKSDQVYKDNVAYQRLFGGEAMVTLVTMDPGHTVAELFTPDGIKQWTKVAAKIRASGQVLSVVSPLTALQWNDNLVSSPSGDITQSVAGKMLAGDLARTKSKAAQAVRSASALATIARINAIPKARRTLANPKYIDFLLYDNPLPKDPKPIRTPLLPFFPDARHAQMVVRLLGNESIKKEGETADLVTAATKSLNFEHAQITTTGAPALLENLNNYLTGGMATLALIAIGIMTLILLLLVQRAVATAAARDRADRHDLGVRHRRLPRDTAHDRHHLRSPGDARHRYRLHDPDARARRGRSRDRSGRAPDSGNLAQPRPGAPRRDVRRDLCVRGVALGEGADAARVRLLLIIGVIAICTCSIIGTLAILGIREFKSPTKGRDFREGPLGRLTVRLGSLLGAGRAGARDRERARVPRRHLVEDKLVLQTDPTQWVNQHSQVIKNLNVLDREVHSSSELGVFVQSRDVFATADRDLRRRLHPRPARRSIPRRC